MSMKINQDQFDITHNMCWSRLLLSHRRQLQIYVYVMTKQSLLFFFWSQVDRSGNYDIVKAFEMWIEFPFSNSLIINCSLVLT